jgi:hypothetical protein
MYLLLESTTECPKSREPIGILIIFVIFIYRLKLKVKRLTMAFLGIPEGTGVCC